MPFPFRLNDRLLPDDANDFEELSALDNALHEIEDKPEPARLRPRPDAFDSVRTFQKSRGLKPDGVVAPKMDPHEPEKGEGPTLLAINAELREKQRRAGAVREARPTHLMPIRGGIGPGQRNDPADLKVARTGFALLGAAPKRAVLQAGNQDAPDPKETTQMVRTFQAQHGLTTDGVMRPGRETQRRAARLLDAKLAMEVGDDLANPEPFIPRPNATIARNRPETPLHMKVPTGSGMGTNNDDTDHRLAVQMAGDVTEARFQSALGSPDAPPETDEPRVQLASSRTPVATDHAKRSEPASEGDSDPGISERRPAFSKEESRYFNDLSRRMLEAGEKDDPDARKQILDEASNLMPSDPDELLAFRQGVRPSAWEDGEPASAERQQEYDRWRERFPDDAKDVPDAFLGQYYVGPDGRLFRRRDEDRDPRARTIADLYAELEVRDHAFTNEELMKDRDIPGFVDHNFEGLVEMSTGGSSGLPGGGGRRQSGNNDKKRQKEKNQEDEKEQPKTRRYSENEEPPVLDPALKLHKVLRREKYTSWWNSQGRVIHNSRISESGQVHGVAREHSFIWKNLVEQQVAEGGAGTGRVYRTNGLRGKKRRYFSWDSEKNEIEVFDSRREHIGSIDPLTGHRTGGPKNRRVPKSVVELDRENEDNRMV